MPGTNRNAVVPKSTSRKEEAEPLGLAGGDGAPAACGAPSETLEAFRVLAEDIPFVVVRLRSDGTVLYANPEAERITGYALGEIVGRPFWIDVAHDEDRSRLMGALWEAAHRGYAETDFRVQTKGGAHRWIEARLRRIADTDEIGGVFLRATEQADVASALLHNEALYQTFLEQSPIGIIHLDARGVVMFENHCHRETTGESADAAWIGLALDKVNGLDERVRSLAARLLSDGEPFDEDDLVFVRTDGKRHVLHIHGAPIRHPDEGIVGGTLMIVDVTEERERAEVLRVLARYDEAEAALRDAALASTSSYAFLDAAAALLGTTAQADRVIALFADDDEEGYAERTRWSRDADGPAPPLDIGSEMEQAFASESIVHLHRDQADGRAVVLLDALGGDEALVLSFDAGRNERGAFLLVCTAALAEPWSEAEHRALGRIGGVFETLWAWMRAEVRYRQVVSAVEDSLFAFSLTATGDRRYSFVTQQIEALTGHAPDTLLSGALSWYDTVVHEDDLDAVRHHDRALRDERESRLIYRIVTPRGDIRWLRESAAPRRERDGRIVVAGILSDLTEAKEAEADFIRAKQDAESANRVKTTFLSTMSHEIRTPLGAISGFADLLLEEVESLGDAPPEIAEFASAIHVSTKKVLRLVNDLFDLASLQSGRIYVERSPVPLHPILVQTAQSYAPVLTERGVELVLDLCNGDPVVLGEMRRLDQVVDHLVSNASKFTEAGHVRIATAFDESAVRLTVEDTGIGVGPDYLSELFEPFSQEDNRLTRNYEGSGLGLAIVKRLVEAMNGTVVAESTKNEGTCFTVTLPRADG